MRLRGLPRELTCGNVELAPVRHCEFASKFQPCVSCEYAYVKFLLLDCCHVHCEHCVVFYDEPQNSPEWDQQVHCSVCNEPRLATFKEMGLPSIYTARFECPCGHEGTLHQLSRHRRTCRQRKRSASSDLDESSVSSSSGASCSRFRDESSGAEGTSEPRPSDESPQAKPFEFIVKGYVAQELNRLKEDVLNTMRLEWRTSEASLRALWERVNATEARPQVNAAIERRLAQVETSMATSANLARLSDRLENVSSRLLVAELVPRSEMNVAEFVRLQSTTKMLWFDLKSLLRDFNRQREASPSEEHEFLLSGYPLSVHVEVDDFNGYKALFIGVATAKDLPYSANWPMRRLLTFSLYDGNGEVITHKNLSTTDPANRDFFLGPDFEKDGEDCIFEMCTIRSLCEHPSYPRSNGMICIGVRAGPS